MGKIMISLKDLILFGFLTNSVYTTYLNQKSNKQLSESMTQLNTAIGSLNNSLSNAPLKTTPEVFMSLKQAKLAQLILEKKVNTLETKIINLKTETTSTVAQTDWLSSFGSYFYSYIPSTTTLIGITIGGIIFYVSIPFILKYITLQSALLSGPALLNQILALKNSTMSNISLPKLSDGTSCVKSNKSFVEDQQSTLIKPNPEDNSKFTVQLSDNHALEMFNKLDNAPNGPMSVLDAYKDRIIPAESRGTVESEENIDSNSEALVKETINASQCGYTQETDALLDSLL